MCQNEITQANQESWSKEGRLDHHPLWSILLTVHLVLCQAHLIDGRYYLFTWVYTPPSKSTKYTNYKTPKTPKPVGILYLFPNPQERTSRCNVSDVSTSNGKVPTHPGNQISSFYKMSSSCGSSSTSLLSLLWVGGLEWS